MHVKPSLLRRLARDERGLSAVEFALILPIMVLLYMGLAEIMMSFMAERRAGHAASAVADLIAQGRGETTDTEVNQILFVGNASMRPFPVNDLSLRITSVQADTLAAPKAVWSKIKGPAYTTKPGAGTTVAGFPANLLLAGDSVIMAEVTYSYKNPIMNVIPRTVIFKDVFYLRPRRAVVITCPTCT